MLILPTAITSKDDLITEDSLLARFAADQRERPFEKWAVEGSKLISQGFEAQLIKLASRK